MTHDSRLFYHILGAMTQSGWTGFWKDQRNAFTTIMQINTSYFADQLRRHIPLNSDVNILDYGCGPGLLLDNLKSSNVNFTGVDINGFYIQQCKQKYPTTTFLEISTNPGSNHDLFEKEIGPNRFDVVVMLSILQYFQSVEEVERTLSFLRDFLKPGGRIVLADIVTENNSPLLDTWSLFKQALVKGKLGALARFIAYLMVSPYRKLSNNNRLLAISEDAIKRVASNLGLKFKVAAGMTIHTSRTSYILEQV